MVTKSDADDTAASATSPNDDPVNTLGVNGINLALQPTATGEIVSGGGMAAPAVHNRRIKVLGAADRDAHRV